MDQSHQAKAPKGQRSERCLPAFAIDDRIRLDIEYELAGELGRLILDSDTQNTALLALGHQLRNLVDGRQSEDEQLE